MNSPDGVRVLVVEDEFLIRIDLAEHLQEAGYRTIEAGSASEAISALENDRSIRIVFTDIQMPGAMDGIALATYVRNRWPPTIIVISSARFSGDMRELPSDCGLFGKPYDWARWPGVLKELAAQLA